MNFLKSYFIMNTPLLLHRPKSDDWRWSTDKGAFIIKWLLKNPYFRYFRGQNLKIYPRTSFYLNSLKTALPSILKIASSTLFNAFFPKVNVGIVAKNQSVTKHPKQPGVITYLIKPSSLKQSKGRPGQSWTHVIDIDHFEDRGEHACNNCIKKIRMDLEKKIMYLFTYTVRAPL